MTNKELLNADLLDILFEHRNKNYGAYALRRNYNERLGKALGIALAVVLALILYKQLKNDGKNGGNNNFAPDIVSVQEIEFEKEKPVEPERPREQERPREVPHTDIIQIGNETTMPDQNDLRTSVIGNELIDGPPLVDPNQIVPDNTPTGTETNTKPQPEPDPTPLPSHPPSFPGGQESWLNYLRKFLNTPDDLEPGQRVEVRVKFWVETDGSISRFEIVQSGGRSFDNEVMRVMKKMPKWEPAVQAGQKVAVSFTQPVIFVGQEEE